MIIVGRCLFVLSCRVSYLTLQLIHPIVPSVKRGQIFNHLLTHCGNHSPPIWGGLKNDFSAWISKCGRRNFFFFWVSSLKESHHSSSVVKILITLSIKVRLWEKVIQGKGQKGENVCGHTNLSMGFSFFSNYGKREKIEKE